MTPRFSIIIPTLNEEKFLPNLLTSLVSQTKMNFEVIVVDGKSRDKTVEKAKTFSERLPLCIYETSLKNVSHQRNVGARKSHGEWLLFVDADSELYPYFFDRLSKFIDREHPELCTTWFAPDSTLSRHALYALIGNIYIEASVMAKRPIAPGSMTIVTKDRFFQVGGYNESLTWGEDFDFSKRVSDSGAEQKILHETLYIFSQRRIRAYGTFSFLKTYIPGSLYSLFMNRAIGRMPGYVMGGAGYTKKKHKNGQKMKWQFDRKVLVLLRELFE